MCFCNRSWFMILIFLFVLSLQDRRDLVGTHPGALEQLGTGTSSSFATNPTHRLRHTPTTDFQPPYFPPPYTVPQQPVHFPEHHVNPDPYAHLNHYNQHHNQYMNTSDRHHLLSGNDPLSNSIQRGFTYDSRRDYGINRPDPVLIPPRGPHDLHESMLSLQGNTGLDLGDAQVGRHFKVHPIYVFISYLF